MSEWVGGGGEGEFRCRTHWRKAGIVRGAGDKWRGGRLGLGSEGLEVKEEDGNV